MIMLELKTIIFVCVYVLEENEISEKSFQVYVTI